MNAVIWIVVVLVALVSYGLSFDVRRWWEERKERQQGQARAARLTRDALRLVDNRINRSR